MPILISNNLFIEELPVDYKKQQYTYGFFNRKTLIRYYL